MHTLTPAFDLPPAAIQGADGFRQLHEKFLSFLAGQNNTLHNDYKKLCASQQAAPTDTLMALAPILGTFLHRLFGHGHDSIPDKHPIHNRHTLKVQFIRRRVAVKNPETLIHPDSAQIKNDMATALEDSHWDDDVATDKILRWLSDENRYRANIQTAIAYGRFALYTAEGRALHSQSTLFHVPKIHTPGALSLTLSPEKPGCYTAGTGINPHLNLSFDLEDSGLSLNRAALESHYCLHCHKNKKDSCRTGLQNRPPPLPNGCPMDQKISEMMMLMSRGDMMGAFGIAMLDNPFLPLTGHRICHDCRASCIFQKQDAVEVPGSETALLRHILALPWGFEIYRILTLWNPLNTICPLPAPPSGYTVLVVGTGPAGIALSHYLLRAGHHVIAIDGLKIDPLPTDLTTPDFIRDIKDFSYPLSTKPILGFGGVSSYGITHRWDKNFLNLMHLTLERHPQFSLFGSTTFGSMVDTDTAASWGVDHIALCMGGGGPKILPLSQESMPKGVRYASDFLMALNHGGVFKSDSILPYELRLPLVVIGGGLTAIDAAVEGMRYYGKMVLNLYTRFKTGVPGPFWESLTAAEQDRLSDYLTHGKALEKTTDPLSLLKSWGGARVLYRGFLGDAPAYTANSPEVQLALNQGIIIQEQTHVSRFQTDDHGWVSGAICGDDVIPAKTVLIAVGCDPHNMAVLPESRFGDMDPRYRGSVVKALASAKNGHGVLCRSLKCAPPRRENPQEVLTAAARDLTSFVVSTIELTPGILEITVNAPLAARQYRPGHFFRLQTYDKTGDRMEPLALTGTWSHPKNGTLGLVVAMSGQSSALCATLKPGDPVSLMGPAGDPSIIPTNQSVILIGGGDVGCAILPALGYAMKAAGCTVTLIAGFKSRDQIFYQDRLENAGDTLILTTQTDIISALRLISPDETAHLMVVGQDAVMGAVQEFLSHQKNSFSAFATLNSPMQCMMGGLCGQCLQPAGDGRLIFACRHQNQNLSRIDFPFLKNRLTQNSLMEKVAYFFKSPKN